MRERGLSYSLKIIDVLMMLCLIALAVFFVPALARHLFHFHQDDLMGFSNLNVFAWRVILCGWGYIVACLGVCVLMWRVCSAIGKGRMFTNQNAQRFRRAFAFMLVASAVSLVACAWLLRWSLATNGSVLLGVVVFGIGLFIALIALVVFAALNRLTREVAPMKSEYDLTV